MTKNESIQLKILDSKQFLYGLLELYKQEFVETQDNTYLEVMDKLNKTLTLIDYLEKNSIELAKKIK